MASRAMPTPAKLTVDDETISDAHAAVALLGKHPKSIPSAFLWWGTASPPISLRASPVMIPQIAGIVMLAANTVPLEQLLPG